MISTERQTRETHAVIFKVNAFMLTKWTEVVFGGRRENRTWMKKCERKLKQRKGKGKVRVFYTFEKVIVIKMIQLICVWWVLQVDTCYRGGGESTLGYQRRIVLHLYVKLNYPDIANKILFLVFVFLFWSFSVFIFLFWYFSVLSFCLEKGKQNYIRAVLHCDIFF